MLNPMPTEISDSYEKLIEDYMKLLMERVGSDRSDMKIYESARSISESITAAVELENERRAERGYQPMILRPDASLFLIVNIHQIVFLPLQLAYGPSLENYDEGEGPQLERFLEMINNDIRTIIQGASEKSIRRDREDIPASIILGSTSENIDHLNLKNFRIWENIYVPAK